MFLVLGPWNLVNVGSGNAGKLAAICVNLGVGCVGEEDLGHCLQSLSYLIWLGGGGGGGGGGVHTGIVEWSQYKDVVLPVQELPL